MLRSAGCCVRGFCFNKINAVISRIFFHNDMDCIVCVPALNARLLLPSVLLKRTPDAHRQPHHPGQHLFPAREAPLPQITPGCAGFPPRAARARKVRKAALAWEAFARHPCPLAPGEGRREAVHFEHAVRGISSGEIKAWICLFHSLI